MITAGISLVFGIVIGLFLLYLLLIFGSYLLAYLFDFSESWWLWLCFIILLVKVF